MTISISAQFDRDKISKDKDYEGHLMVDIAARDPNFQRTPISLALCLDVSGSMGDRTHSNESKIEALKATVHKIIDNLTDKDEIALVTFTDVIETVIPMQAAISKDALHQAANQLSARNSTNMSGGMTEAFVQIGKATKDVRRVLLLTDGMANNGISDRDGLLKLTKDRKGYAYGTDAKDYKSNDKGILVAKDFAVSTFAFGIDACTELLADIAKEGGGNAYFIKDTKDVRDVFARELGGAVSCMAQNIQVLVEPAKDNKVLECLNDYTVEDDKGAATIKAEDIYVDETKHILVKMLVAKPDGKVKDRPFSIAHIKVSYDDVKAGKRETEELNIKVEFVKEADADKDAKLAVAEQVAVLVAAKAQVKAAVHAKAGNFSAAGEAIRLGGVFLRDAAARGSTFAASMSMSYEADAHEFTEQDYEEKTAGGIACSALNATRNRSVGAKGLSAGYANRVQKGMVASFTGQGPAGTPAQQVAASPKHHPAPVVPPSSGGFAKKRSR